jgi:hypothetical protein
MTASDYQLGGDVGFFLASKEFEVSLEYRTHVNTGFETTIIEQEVSARGSVSADDVLVAVHRQQHARLILVRGRDRNDPIVTKVLSKRPLFYGARRVYREGARQGVCPFRPSRIERGHVQDRHQPSVDAKNRRAGAAQIRMSRSEMLASVNGDGPFLSETGTDAVRAFNLFGPNPAEPNSRILEFARIRILTAMLDCDARGVTEQDNISCIANDMIKPVDLLLRCRDEAAKRFTKRL